MKTIALTLGLVLGLTTAVFSQEETLFDNAKIVGAFGGPFVEYHQILGDEGLMVGGGGAVQFKHFFFGGYGIGTHFPEATLLNAKSYVVNISHGGFWLGYTIPAHKLFHLYVSARPGWGQVRFKEDRDDKDRDAIYADRIFAFTPEIGVEINVTDFLRIAATGGYRLIADVDNLPDDYANDDFSGFMGGLTFRFGSF